MPTPKEPQLSELERLLFEDIVSRFARVAEPEEFAELAFINSRGSLPDVPTDAAVVAAFSRLHALKLVYIDGRSFWAPRLRVNARQNGFNYHHRGIPAPVRYVVPDIPEPADA